MTSTVVNFLNIFFFLIIIIHYYDIIINHKISGHFHGILLFLKYKKKLLRSSFAPQHSQLFLHRNISFQNFKDMH